MKSASKTKAANSESTPQGCDGRTVPAQRILVAEDSPVTQDLLKLVLEQREHHVEVVADGEAALAALNAGSYDVALLDFHLPKIDGLEVAARFRAANKNANSPRFVAITSDIKGLLSHTANCENFDEVIPKPFELEDVLAVIERKGDSAEESARPVQLPAAQGAAQQPAKTKLLRGKNYEFLRWPDDFNADRLSARGVRASLGNGQFDAILLNAPASVRDLSVIWTTKTLHLLPIIDMTGTLKNQADLDGSKLHIAETGELDRLIQSFHDRRAELHTDLVYTDDIGEKLVGRMYVSSGALTPSYNPTAKELVGYNAALDFRSIEKEMQELLGHDFVKQEFFDRFHSCDRCGSSQLNIREECCECSSAHLKEEAYLHHFKCAYQGPEPDFRQGDDLVCPKCRMELSHFSVDYDKPGSMLQCQNCGHATSEPAIGFVCMECEAHFGGEKMPTRDVYAYTLSSRGQDFAKVGRAMLEDANVAMRFTELPMELIVAMNAELKKYQTDKTPFSLLDISYENAREIECSDGSRMFAKSRDLYLENFGNLVRKEDCVVKGQSYDFVLLKGTAPKEARKGLDYLCKEASASLKVDLGVKIDVFGPEDFS